MGQNNAVKTNFDLWGTSGAKSCCKYAVCLKDGCIAVGRSGGTYLGHKWFKMCFIPFQSF